MISYHTFMGSHVSEVVEEVSLFRIKYFKEFPYLYEGNMEYEKNYFDEFIKDNKAYVEIIKNSDGTICGVATGIPLASDVSILNDTQALFQNQGYDCSKFFYIGEIIISPEFRNLKLARKLLGNVEKFAINNNYIEGTLATVVRDSDDPRTPFLYNSSDHVWEKYGYTKTNLMFEYSWPTIKSSGDVEEMNNPMVFWTKKYL